MEWVVGASTIALVVVTAYYAGQNQRMVQEMRRAREAQLLAHVELLVEHDRWRPEILTLIIRNSGGGAARNVKFSFDRDVPYRMRPGDELPATLADLPVFQNIPVLAAGQSHVLYFNIFNDYWNREDAPKKFNYTVRYVDVFDHSKEHTAEVDVGLMYQTAPVWEHPLKDIAKDLRDFPNAVRHLRDIADAVTQGRRLPMSYRLRRWWSQIRAARR